MFGLSLEKMERICFWKAQPLKLTLN